MTSSVSLGVIAEDTTDFEALREIVQRILGREIKVRKRVGNGCAKVRAKARAWLDQLADDGCSHAVIVYDLDRNPENNALNNPTELRRKLAESCGASKLKNHFICIPIEEMEAWFWADDALVKRVGRGHGSAHPSPENLPQPKEALIRLSRDNGKKPRYATSDNLELAKLLDLSICKQRCPSFKGLTDFLENLP